MRAKLAQAIDYLAVAPTVVAVATDLDLEDHATTISGSPTGRAIRERFAELAELLDLGGSADRILASLERPADSTEALARLARLLSRGGRPYAVDLDGGPGPGRRSPGSRSAGPGGGAVGTSGSAAARSCSAIRCAG